MTTEQQVKDFSELAQAVAIQIVEDYRGLLIHGEQHAVMTGQLEARIARALRAFHYREGHTEPTK